MFNLEGSPMAAEMSFAEQYQSAVRKLQSQSARSLQHQHSSGPVTTTRPKVGLGKTNLSAIASVAAVGVASMSAVSAVDQILSLTTLPSFPPEVTAGLQHGGSAHGSHVQQDNIPAMIVLDLACAGCKTLNSSVNLLEAARGRLPSGTKADLSSAADVLFDSVSPDSEHKHPSQTHGQAGILGVVKLLSQLSQLMALGTTEGLGEF